MEIEIPNYTESDFDSVAPYEFLHGFREQNLKFRAIEGKLSKMAASFKINNFKQRYKDYLADLNGVICAENSENNVTVFTSQPLELDCGQWHCDDDGIYINGESGKLYACPHPIMPVERLVNIDTLAEKLTLGPMGCNRITVSIFHASILPDFPGFRNWLRPLFREKCGILSRKCLQALDPFSQFM